MKKVIITGMRAPYEGAREDEEVWGCSLCYQHQPDLARLYNADELGGLTCSDADYIANVNKHGCQVWMQAPHPEIPNSRAIPIKEMRAFFGLPYDNWTSTISYMVAHAIFEGAPSITMHRVLEVVGSKDYLFQKAALDFWLGLAVGRGIKVRISDGSMLCRPHPWETGLYGYELHDQWDTVHSTMASAAAAIKRLPLRFYRTDAEAIVEH